MPTTKILTISGNRFSRVTSRFFYLLGCVLLIGLSFPSVAETRLPYDIPHKRLGVVTCAGSNCHGAISEQTTTRVLQNEYVLWSREDPHAKAYKVLFSPESQQIAKNLGLGKAQNSDLCLDCHTHNVRLEFRGKRFQLNNGVDCEVCHGPAEKWIETHTVENRPFIDNIKEGMYELAHPIKRAELCYSCHVGKESQFLNHKLYGAGHPRLRFELDNFSATQPAHFVIEKEYDQRKGKYSNLQIWLAGQLISAQYFLENLLNQQIRQAGLSAEPALLDCHSCHHPFDAETWQAVDHQALDPGVLRFNDTAFYMIHLASTAGVLPQGQTLLDKVKLLHQASEENWPAIDARARDLLSVITAIKKDFATISVSPENAKKLMANLLRAGQGAVVRDLMLAEQIAWGIEANIYFQQSSGSLSGSQIQSIDSDLNGLFELLEVEKNYSAAKFRQIISRIAAKLA